MARSIYITSAEGHSGKSTIALGVLDTLSHELSRIGVFRPIARSTRERDYVLELLLDHDSVELGYEDCIGVDYEAVHRDPDAALARIVARYKAIEARCEAVVIIGSDYTDVGSPTELSFNARIAANLGAPVLLVLGGRIGRGEGEQLGKAEARTADDMSQLTEIALDELRSEHAQLLAVVANRADPKALDAITSAISNTVTKVMNEAALLRPSGAVGGGAASVAPIPTWAIPEDPFLVAPSIATIMDAIDGTFYRGDPKLLSREALGLVVAAMSMENVLARLIEGSVVVIPADRAEVLLAVLMAATSEAFPSIAGIVLNGPFELPETVDRLLAASKSRLPIVRTQHGTYDTAARIMSTRGRLAAESQRKYDTALALFEKHVDAEKLRSLLNISKSDVVTPLMFEFGILERARSHRKHIVLPEGNDDRILRAAATLLSRDVAELTILGEEIEVRSQAIGLGLDISRAAVVSNHDAVLTLRFAEEYARLRAHKGISVDRAREVVSDPSYFGTMMVQLGMADGMVSGATHTTAQTIKPSFEVIKTKPGVSIVSSVFLMALADRILVYGDCAINPEPDAEQLADIAISSAETASEFGIEPRIAMLSYSTGDSGTGADVDKVRAATALVRERRPDLLVEGPIQYDAAANAIVAAAKMPASQVAGRATVFVFPDLNSGNNTYKAVQRSAGAVAIGPILQGLNKPVNDLSRGALVQDIVNTVAITAIQAYAAELAASRPATGSIHLNPDALGRPIL